MNNLRSSLIAAFMAIPLLTISPQAHAVPVGLELSLLVDVSGSISSAEYNLQRSGYVQAFQSSAVQNAILSSVRGSIAVNFIQWSGPLQHVQSVAYTLINSAASANAFAAAVGSVTRLFDGSTAIGSAIDFATPLFATNGFEGDRQVIDISGDGAANAGESTPLARDVALAAGVNQINGLPILGESGLLAYYTNNVKGGTGSFVLPASSFASFATAIEEKLVREIAPIPEPASLALLAVGMAAVVRLRRNRV